VGERGGELGAADGVRGGVSSFVVPVTAFSTVVSSSCGVGDGCCSDMGMRQIPGTKLQVRSAKVLRELRNDEQRVKEYLKLRRVMLKRREGDWASLEHVVYALAPAAARRYGTRGDRRLQ
jgi:hypothetical protein